MTLSRTFTEGAEADSHTRAQAERLDVSGMQAGLAVPLCNGHAYSTYCLPCIYTHSNSTALLTTHINVIRGRHNRHLSTTEGVYPTSLYQIHHSPRVTGGDHVRRRQMPHIHSTLVTQPTCQKHQIVFMARSHSTLVYGTDRPRLI